MIGDGLGLDTWFDEPAYKAASGTFSGRGAFILAKLKAHDAAKLDDVLADLYRDDLNRCHRHCPGFRARRGTVVGSGW